MKPRNNGGTLLAALALVVMILAALGLVDRIERDTEARLEFLRIADEKCIPMTRGEIGIATHTGRQMRCEVWANATPGMARRLVSAAVMDVPQQ